MRTNWTVIGALAFSAAAWMFLLTLPITTRAVLVSRPHAFLIGGRAPPIRVR
jgi:hypothetical protein